MLDMPTRPTTPVPGTHHDRLCWVSRWYGDKQPDGKRPRYTKRWFDVDKRQAMALYAAWLARWDSDPTLQDPRQASTLMNVAELCAAYLKHAEATYIKGGKITSHVYKTRAALQSLTDAHGDLPAVKLDMPMLAKWRDAMARTGRSARYVNDMLQIVRAAYQWAAERGDVPSHTWQALCGVSRIRASRRKRVQPIAWDTVEATLPHLSDVIGAMIRVLWHSGMRPEDVCVMRGMDIDQGGDVWLYQPESHKTDHLDVPDRIIALGPQAQAVITPWLDRDLTAYLFRPVEGSGRQLSNYGETYTSASLRRAVHRGCERAFPAPDDATPEQVKAWHKAHRWNPNQLRHAKGTEIRKRFGLEASRVSLGHTTAATTELYAERDLALAKRVARQIG